MTGLKTLVLIMQLDRPVDNIKHLYIELPSEFSDINIDRPNQRAMLNGIAQGFGVLFGCNGARLNNARIIPSMLFNDSDDECERCRKSGLLEDAYE